MNDPWMDIRTPDYYSKTRANDTVNLSYGKDNATIFRNPHDPQLSNALRFRYDESVATVVNLNIRSIAGDSSTVYCMLEFDFNHDDVYDATMNFMSVTLTYSSGVRNFVFDSPMLEGEMRDMTDGQFRLHVWRVGGAGDVQLMVGSDDRDSFVDIPYLEEITGPIDPPDRSEGDWTRASWILLGLGIAIIIILIIWEIVGKAAGSRGGEKGDSRKKDPQGNDKNTPRKTSSSGSKKKTGK